MQLSHEKADLKMALQKVKILETKSRHHMMLYHRAQKNLTKMHLDFKKWQDSIDVIFSNRMNELQVAHDLLEVSRNELDQITLAFDQLQRESFELSEASSLSRQETNVLRQKRLENKDIFLRIRLSS